MIHSIPSPLAPRDTKPLRASSYQPSGVLREDEPHLASEPLLDFDIPISPRQGATPGGMVFESEPEGMAAEQFRLMQRRLTTLRPHGTSVLLTSPGAGDGKSLNAHNLAYALAESGQKTLLLELDLRRPTLARYLGRTPLFSVADVLKQRASPEQALCRVSSLPLFFLGSTTAADHPADLLRSVALRGLLQWAHENFQWIVVDGPPVLPVADVEELLPWLDLVLLVIRERKTPASSLRRVSERLGKRCDFVIYNDVRASVAYGYGYGA